MLARIDEIPGVRRSLAECSGHYFLVELAGGAGDGVAPRVLEVLGPGARLLPPEAAEVQHEARRRGEPWVTAAGARSLSYVEGRMLGVRVSAAVSRKAGLTAEEAERLAEAVREEMFTYVERLHAGLDSAGRFFAVWPELAAKVARRCAPWLGAARAGELTDGLVGHFAAGADERR